MYTNKTKHSAARVVAILALTFAFAGLLGPAPGTTAWAAAQAPTESTASTASTSSEPPIPSFPTGKLDVYLTDYWTGGPLAGWQLYVEALPNWHLVTEGQTDATGFYGVLLPPGKYRVDSGALPSWCLGFSADVAIVLNQTTTVRGEAGCMWWR